MIQPFIWEEPLVFGNVKGFEKFGIIDPWGEIRSDAQKFEGFTG